ncbi:hypothetical protein GALMADRAFT_1140491 [Galerina marginata CBS 339.88]|uniref:Uncharacterized protein n=1 Tax=Galerina marginata (strain CBS 339.88) TaxID=685588 RepID=A0A067S7I0_GALM3|nr:hypothetical protein GALMADRAFT_1140491 [Galerina marginata CBS 339.88]
MPHLPLRFPLLVPPVIIRQKDRFHRRPDTTTAGCCLRLEFFSISCPLLSSRISSYSSSGVRRPFLRHFYFILPSFVVVYSRFSSFVVRLCFHFCLYPLLPSVLFCESPSTFVTHLYSSRLFTSVLFLALTNTGALRLRCLWRC